jgi:hypothetical protein
MHYLKEGYLKGVSFQMGVLSLCPREWTCFHKDRSNFPINTPSGFLRGPETDDFRGKILVLPERVWTWSRA